MAPASHPPAHDMVTQPLNFLFDMYGHLLIDGHFLLPTFAFSSFILWKDRLQKLVTSLPCAVTCKMPMHGAPAI